MRKLFSGLNQIAAGLGRLGYAFTGHIDPVDVASGALGLLLGTVLIYFFSR